MQIIKRPKVPEPIQRMLWGKAAGRCQFTGCNKILWQNSTTKESVNIADIAHIIAFGDEGPRSDKNLSEKLAKEVTNLMLLCGECHKTIDKNEETYSVDLLREMKKAHERRIEIVAGISYEKQSEILLYGANVGEHDSPVTYKKATCAMLPEWYPASSQPISLGMLNSSFRDYKDGFWQIESEHLRCIYKEHVKLRLMRGSIEHLSVFAFAPQPLLMLLGFLLSDIPTAEVYQLHREPQDWCWQPSPQNFDYQIIEPEKIIGAPALVLSLSATILPSRITSVLGNDVTIWQVTIPEPHNDFLKSKEQLRLFREKIRLLMNCIKMRHGEEAILHVFPAVPVAIAIEMGRILMPKADLPIRVYDQNRSRGGFVCALDLNGRTAIL